MLQALIKAFKEVKDSTKPVVVHINTLKGKGYAPAEKCKEQWHYSGPFDIETGKPLFDNVEVDYSSVTCEYLLEKMKNDSSVVAITSGTPTVMGFTEDKRKEAGSQFVDVGIAEETAVALASGIAVNGGKPFYGVYSSFVQRTFDQVSQDVCINNSPITMVIYQGSVYGMNDVTHLGFQDIPMLSNIPNLVYLAPATKEEYLAMLDWSMEQTSYPVAIKLPGGPMISDGSRVTKDFGRLNRYEVVQTGEKIAIIGLGTFFELAKEAAKLLKEEAGINATVINPYYITGLGIAVNGGKPFYGVYSSFVQRTFDQVSQDVCINNSPITMVIYQGSVYGMNDVTHLGFQDIPMLSNIPNLVYLAPATKEEYLAMLDWSMEQTSYPVAIKLPGGPMISDGSRVTKDFGRLNRYEVVQTGEKIAIIGLGTFFELAKEAAKLLKEEAGINATVINPYYITGLDEALLTKLKQNHDTVITLEDGILDGGFGEKIARFYGASNMKVMNYGLKKEFLDRYDVDAVLKENHLTAEQIAEDVLSIL